MFLNVLRADLLPGYSAQGLKIHPPENLQPGHLVQPMTNLSPLIFIHFSKKNETITVTFFF